jgi:glycosyltransferase involved in cell wall biosynthesis
MKTKEPPALVSVVLCTFNRAELLERAVDSVLGQSYPQFELILVNDGSTDSTHEVIERMLRTDNRIHAIHRENRGLAQSRNDALNRARGVYFSFIDDDDEYTPEHLRERVRYFDEHPETDIVWGGLVPQGPEDRHYVIDMENPDKKIHLRDCFVSGTLFGKLSVFRRLGGFRDLEYAEDWDFIKRAQEQFVVQRVDVPTYLYYIDAPNRMSDLYADGKGEAIREYRRKGRR